MTVCVAVKVHDCIVFATDSATSLVGSDANGNQVISNIYKHGNKLFNLHKDLPISGMTAGIGNFGNCSISTISKDFRRLLMSGSKKYTLDKNNYSIEAVAGMAREYLFEERFKQLEDPPSGSFDFWIGGYSSGQDLGETWRVHISDGECGDPICEASRDTPANISWGGQPEAINRLVLGYGSGLSASLLSAGLEEQNLERMLDHVALHTQVDIVNPAMPTMDAIDLTVFLVDTTRKFVKFLPGPNTVGGAIDVATVTKHEGFKWVMRKHYYPSKLNPLETDHA